MTIFTLNVPGREAYIFTDHNCKGIYSEMFCHIMTEIGCGIKYGKMILVILQLGQLRTEAAL